MENLIFSFALSIILINSITLSLNSTTDKYALTSFKNSISFDPDHIITNWSQNTPVCNWIGVSCGLKHHRVTALNLSGYGLAGTVAPHLGNLTFMRYLDISSNRFTGSLPSELSKLRRLKVMNVGVNSFTGEIPTWLGSLPQLEKLYLYSNNLSGSIPHAIFNVSSIREIRISNNSLSGMLPSDMCNNMPNIQILSLAQNRIGGQIPSNIWKCTHLEVLLLSYNNFIGNIPREIGRLSVLTRLYLGYVSIRGGIPAEIGNLSRLEVLSIDNASLTGDIPSSIFNISSFKILSFTSNNLSGELPQEIGTLLPRLESFSLSLNSLYGSIPSSLFNSSTLKLLDLSNNEFSGSLPSDVGEMMLLQRINLSGNQLKGYLPSDLCKMYDLGELTLSDNMLLGPIPECLADVKSLREIYLDSNQLSGQFPYQLGNLKMMDSLDLSSNKLSGDIPGTIGGCQSLGFLNLSNNRFKGFIPNSLGSVKGLTTVDLSYNNMSGSIPNSIADLRFLEYFDVSNNELEGRIPDRGFFKNLTAQSFANNLALCGPKRFLVQPCPKDDGGSRGKKNVQLIKYMVLSLMLIVLTVIVMLVLIWRQKKKRVPVLSDDVSPLTIEWIRMRNRRRISYIELEQGTRSFSEANLLGRGSYGYVFKATLADGLKAAVKVFNFQQEGATESFDTEIEILGSIRHRNLVRLVGWCSYREFRALIVTYMPNGSLDEWLHSTMYALGLIQRLEIAIDVASALEYLHHGYISTIVHSNVKPSNVLLDQDMVAHLSDFGISKLFDGGEGIIHTQAPTTIGYAAPELVTEGKVSTTGDVYSFGIMLLEIFTGKKPTDNMFSKQMSLKEWASEALQRNAINEIVVTALFSMQDQHYSAKEQCVSSVFELAIKCLAVSPHERINMIKAATTLHKIKETIVASTERPRNRYAYPVRILSAY